jgi:hypothetical protein
MYLRFELGMNFRKRKLITKIPVHQVATGAVVYAFKQTTPHLGIDLSFEDVSLRICCRYQLSQNIGPKTFYRSESNAKDATFTRYQFISSIAIIIINILII